MIPETHAVVNPGTVMVHPQHATIAYSAVVRPIWLILGASPLAKTTIPALFGFKRCLELQRLSSRLVLTVEPFRSIWDRA